MVITGSQVAPNVLWYIVSPLLAGWINGFLHVVLGPDHIAVVVVLSQFNKPLQAFQAGIHWSVSHALGLGVIGIIFAILQSAGAAQQFSEWLERWGGIVIGSGLIGFGIFCWVKRRWYFDENWQPTAMCRCVHHASIPNMGSVSGPPHDNGVSQQEMTIPHEESSAKVCPVASSPPPKNNNLDQMLITPSPKDNLGQMLITPSSCSDPNCSPDVCERHMQPDAIIQDSLRVSRGEDPETPEKKSSWLSFCSFPGGMRQAAVTWLVGFLQGVACPAIVLSFWFLTKFSSWQLAIFVVSFVPMRDLMIHCYDMTQSCIKWMFILSCGFSIVIGTALLVCSVAGIDLDPAILRSDTTSTKVHMTQSSASEEAFQMVSTEHVSSVVEKQYGFQNNRPVAQSHALVNHIFGGPRRIGTPLAPNIDASVKVNNYSGSETEQLAQAEVANVLIGIMGRAKHNYERLKKLKAKKAAEAKFQRRRQQRVDQRQKDKVTGKAQEKRRQARQKKNKELEKAGKVQIGKVVAAPLPVRILQERKWRLDNEELQSNIVEKIRRDGKPSFGFKTRGTEKHVFVLDKMSKYNVASCKEGAVLPPHLVERCQQRKDRLTKLDNALAAAKIPISAARAHIAQKFSKSVFAKRKRKQYARDVIVPLLEVPKGSHARLVRAGLLKAIRTGKDLVVELEGEATFHSLVQTLSAKPQREDDKMLLRGLDIILRICLSPDVNENKLSGPLRMWRRAFCEHFRPPSRNRAKTLKLLEPWRLQMLTSRALEQDPIEIVLGDVFMPQLPPLLAAARACRRRVILYAPPSALSCSRDYSSVSPSCSSSNTPSNFGDQLWQNWGTAPKPKKNKPSTRTAENIEKMNVCTEEEPSRNMSQASISSATIQQSEDHQSYSQMEWNAPTKPTGRKTVFADSDDERDHGNSNVDDTNGFLIGLDASSNDGEDCDADWRDDEWNDNDEDVAVPTEDGESEEPFFVEPVNTRPRLSSNRDLVSSSEENDFAKLEVGAPSLFDEEGDETDFDREQTINQAVDEPFFTDGAPLEVDEPEHETFEGGLADYEDEGSYSDGLSDDEYARELAELDEFMANDAADQGKGIANKKKRQQSFDRPAKKMKKIKNRR
eukprot:gene659-484_t